MRDALVVKKETINNNLILNGFEPRNSDNKELDKYSNSIMLLFPFSWSIVRRKKKKEIVKDNRSIFNNLGNGWKKSNIVNNDTRFFNYIIDKLNYETELNLDEFVTRGVSGFFEKSVLPEQIKEIIEYLKEGEAYNGISKLCLEIDRFILCLFDGGIGFFCIPIFLTEVRKINNDALFRLQKRIKRLVLDKNIKGLVTDELNAIFNLSKKYVYNISFYEEKGKDANKLKYCMLSSFYFKCNEKIKDSNIPFWFSGLLPLRVDAENPNLFCRDYKYRRTASRKTYSYASYNVISATVEGCCSCNYIDVSNSDILQYASMNMWKSYQHMFINYIMSLRQYYFLHNITRLAAQDCISDKLINFRKKIGLVQNIEKAYSIFRNSYLFNRVSAEEKVQELYDVMQYNMGIKEFSDEAMYTIEPIRMFYENILDKIRNAIIYFISGCGFINVIVSLYNCFNCEKKLSQVITIGIIIAVLILTFAIALWFLPIPRRSNLSKKSSNNPNKRDT